MGIEIQPDWAEKRKWWYSQTYILFEIVKQLANKETAFIEKKPPEIERPAKVIRCINSATIDYLKSNFEAFRFFTFPNYNIYFSLANYERMPQFSFAPPERREQYNAWTGGEYKKHITGYDFGIDLDSEKIEDALKDAQHIHKLYDEYKIPHSVKYSGSKGFHIVVPYKYLPQLPVNKLIEMLGELASMMSKIDKLQTIDTTIFDDRRVFKVAYSWDRGRIVLPLDDCQLAKFDLSIVQPEYCQKAIQIKGRGLLTRHTDQTPEQARVSFWKMASNFIEVKKWTKK